MRFVFLLGVMLGVFMLAGSATAGNQIDTSDVYIMAYYKMSEFPEIDLSRAIQEFDYVRESTGQYVEGTITIWHNYPNGRDTGEGLDVEIVDGVDTGVPFSTDVTVRVKSDGWVAAWLTNEQDMGDMVFWNDVGDRNKVPSDTTLGQAIWRVTDRMGASYNKGGVNYYSYKYPEADRLLIGGRLRLYEYTYYFLIPSEIVVYDADILWTSYLRSLYSYYNNYGVLKMNGEEIYNKNTTNFGIGLYEYTKDSLSIEEDIQRDKRQTIYMKSSGWSTQGQCLFQSAIALLYKSG